MEHPAREGRGGIAAARRDFPLLHERPADEPRERAAIFSFVVEGLHPHDVGTLLDREGVAVRAGHHCCQPLMTRLGLAATVRASLALYNTRDEIDALAAAVGHAREMFA